MSEKEAPLQKTFRIELALLKALSIREHYDNYFAYVIYDRLLEETRVFLDGYKLYYELYPDHKQIDFDTFLTQFTTNWHANDMHQQMVDEYTLAINVVKKAESKDAEVTLLGLINKQLIDRINTIAIKPFTSDDLRKELDAYDLKRVGIIKEYDLDLCLASQVDFSSIDKSLGIPYCHEPLNDALGGMVQGSLVLYNAAFGIGKTAEIHEQVACTLRWKKRVGEKRPIIWINTEGTPSEVYGRQWSNLYRDHIVEGYRGILANKDKIVKNFIKNFGENSLLVFRGNKKGLNYIRSKILKYNPCLVVLDMAAAINMPASKTMSETASLEVYFDTLRDFASAFCPIIATVQAGNGAKWFDTKENKWRHKQWPDSDDIYGSKSAIQGAAETIITIGRDDEHENTRYLRTTKLKSEAAPVRFTCELNKKYSSYEFVERVRNSYD